jgi:hypothetical protein
MQVLVEVATWLADLPVASLPLWQLAQLVATVKVLWLTLAPVHTVVDLWHDSQVAVVAMWLADLPVATVPLWQLAQLVVTAATLAWYLAGSQFG